MPSDEERIERIRETGHKIINLVVHSGLSIEDQVNLVEALHSSFITSVKKLAEQALRDISLAADTDNNSK